MKINDDLQKELSLQNLQSLLQKQKDSISTKNQKASFLKCIVLILGTFLMFGNNYSFDNPQALQTQLIQQLDITISQFNLLYSAFAFPNIFLTLIGGVITNILGVRVAIIGFSLAIVIAQLIISFGGLYQNFWLMLLGRIIFGTASENLLIAQTTIIGKWFRGKELSTAIGYVMAIPEFACGMNSFITPIIYNAFGLLAYPLFFSAFLCFLSFICGNQIKKFIQLIRYPLVILKILLSLFGHLLLYVLYKSDLTHPFWIMQMIFCSKNLILLIYNLEDC
ncbi:unnamed protein product [Paramecium primaurelia]|uniref:Major facilitator superfamily (MFS) profile domain-containing protein n=1 Tax=Paramecium primaurelia TaxID=5886 RepID=A0A8S1N3F5_PARPR|nr:unnamed protein product [Paramecium primaurelia]